MPRLIFELLLLLFELLGVGELVQEGCQSVKEVLRPNDFGIGVKCPGTSIVPAEESGFLQKPLLLCERKKKKKKKKKTVEGVTREEEEKN